MRPDRLAAARWNAIVLERVREELRPAAQPAPGRHNGGAACEEAQACSEDQLGRGRGQGEDHPVDAVLATAALFSR